jgi:hypothetical protein
VKQPPRKTPEEALRASVDALGGLQEIGHEFKPEYEPGSAGQWLSHCLTAGCRDKLSLAQIVHIFRKAQSVGEHSGFEVFAAICGYTAAPIATDTQLVDAVKRAEAAKREAIDAARDLEMLSDNPRLMAIMRAANLKVTP